MSPFLICLIIPPFFFSLYLRAAHFAVQLAITQSISGTGGLRIGTAFLARFFPNGKTIYLPSPTWGNHIPIAKDAGLEVKQYK